MMLTQNKDVIYGQANGLRVRMKAVKAKAGETPHVLKLDCGTLINVLSVSQIKTLIVEHKNDDITPRVFEVKPNNWTFKTKLEVGPATMNVNMKGKQFPIISNSSTTGHKLQDCSLDAILVNDWQYKQNLPYVVL
jgi:hypothetical protein